MMGKRYISYNMLSIYEECPCKYKFHYIDGLAKLYRQEKSYLSFGESLHRTLEEFFKIRETTQRTKEKLSEILKRVWVKKGYTTSEEEQQYMKEAERLLEIFYDTQDISVVPFRLEEFFRVPVGDFFLTGRIDRIDLLPETRNKLEIIDYKTGKFIPKQEEIDDDLQLSIYALGVLKKYPMYYPEKISMYFFQHGQKLTTTRTPEQLRKIESALIDKVAAISSDTEFAPRETPFCKSCDYLLICPLMGLGACEEKTKTRVEEQIEKKNQLEDELKKCQSYYQSLTQDLYAIHNYSVDISSTLDIATLGEKISAAFRSVSGARRSVLFLWDESDGRFDILNQFGFSFPEDFSVVDKKIYEYFKSCDFEIAVSDEYKKDNPFSFILDDSLGIKNYIVVPLVTKDKVFGLMVLADIEGARTPSNKHLKTLLTSIADQSVISIYNANLYRYAIYDGLTKLCRGSYFQERMKQEMSRAARSGENLTLIMADIDNFKKINDTYGHVEGDRILREVGRKIKSKIRTTDIAGRYGGEEFAVLLPSTESSGGVVVAENIRKNIESDIRTCDGKPVTASFGVAEYAEFMKTPSDFVKIADEFLYHAKRTGKNKVVSKK